VASYEPANITDKSMGITQQCISALDYSSAHAEPSGTLKFFVGQFLHISICIKSEEQSVKDETTKSAHVVLLETEDEAITVIAYDVNWD
jgi:hypothetical protein